MHHHLVVSRYAEVLIAAKVVARVEVDCGTFIEAAQGVQAAITLFDVTVHILRQFQLRINVFQIPAHQISLLEVDFLRKQTEKHGFIKGQSFERIAS